MAKTAETNVVASQVDAVWRSKPKITPRNNNSSITDTLSEVSNRLGMRFQGGRTLNSASPTLMAIQPQKAITMPARRNPAGNCQLRLHAQLILRSWNCLTPIHRMIGNASITAANRTARSKKRENSVSLRKPRPGISNNGWLHQKSTGARAAPRIKVPSRKTKIFHPVDKGTSK